MVHRLALLTNIFLPSAALAISRQNRQSQTLKDAVVSNVAYTPNWAGVFISEASGTFTSVTGTFAVPTFSGSNNSAVSIWVGIDGDTCQTAMFQAGVDVVIGGGYSAWYEWYPDYAYDFSGISINAGDVITATVNASSTTSGIATVENLTNGQTVRQELASPYALCQQDAAWVSEEYAGNGGQVAGTIVITNATADGVYTPSSRGATLIETEGVTSVTVNGSTITIRYM